MEKYKATANNNEYINNEVENSQDKKEKLQSEAEDKATKIVGDVALNFIPGGKAISAARKLPVVGGAVDKAWNGAVKHSLKNMGNNGIPNPANKIMGQKQNTFGQSNKKEDKNSGGTAKSNNSLFNKLGGSASKLKSSDLINKGDLLSMLPKPLKIKIIIGCSIAFFFMMMVFVVFEGDDIHNLELMNTVSANSDKSSSNNKCTSDEISSNLVYVGGSRIVGMKDALGDSSSKFISEVGVGYDWLKNTASSSIDEKLKDNSDSIVILSLGISDLLNIDNYLNFYDELVNKYSSNKFYILSVNPIDGSKASSNGYSLTNNDIDIFNNKMKSKFGDKFIDANTGISKFDTVDGIHYTSETYKKINDYVVNNLVNDNNITCSSSIVESGEYTAWTQGDPKWGLIPVGSGPGNLAQIGCAVTSIAIQIARSGVNTSLSNLNPGTVCQNLQFSGEAVIWTSVSNFTSEFAFYNRANVSGLSGVGIYNALKPYLNDKYYMIIEVNYGQHWVAIKSIDSNGTIHIQDPATVLVDDDLSKVYQGYNDVIIYEKK